MTFHCTFQKTAYFHVGLFLLLTLWVFVSHFGRLCWGRVSVRQPANMQLHRRRTGGEAVGVVGEHPIEERKKITLFFTMSLISSQFESERSEKSRMDHRKKKKTKQTARCISTETSLFMRNKGRRMRDHLSFGLFPPAVNTRESGLAASVVSSPTSHCNGESPFLLVCLLLGHRIA